MSDALEQPNANATFLLMETAAVAKAMPT